MRRFCRWLVAEGELDHPPTDGIEIATAPDKPVPLLTDEEITALLKTCALASRLQVGRVRRRARRRHPLGHIEEPRSLLGGTDGTADTNVHTDIACHLNPQTQEFTIAK